MTPNGSGCLLPTQGAVLKLEGAFAKYKLPEMPRLRGVCSSQLKLVTIEWHSITLLSASAALRFPWLRCAPRFTVHCQVAAFPSDVYCKLLYEHEGINLRPSCLYIIGGYNICQASLEQTFLRDGGLPVDHAERSQ